MNAYQNVGRGVNTVAFSNFLFTSVWCVWTKCIVLQRISAFSVLSPHTGVYRIKQRPLVSKSSPVPQKVEFASGLESLQFTAMAPPGESITALRVL